MDIEAKRASLDTLSVTIQTLHVDGKQMTLAVFRQLPVKYRNQDSKIWGYVRYAIRDDGDLWLVFSHEGKLYRRPLNPKQNPFADRVNRIQLLRLSISNLERGRVTYNADELAKNKRDLEYHLAALEVDQEEDRDRVVYEQALLKEYPQLFIAV